MVCNYLITIHNDFIMIPGSFRMIHNDSILNHRQIVNLLQRHNREGKNNGHLPRVKIHNIISGLPKPEIEMLYAVYQGTFVTNYIHRVYKEARLEAREFL